MDFLDTNDIPCDAPVLDPQLLQPFPDSIDSVVSYGSNDGAAFAGPRVLFPDGTSSSTFQVNAVFTRDSFCFKHSIAALRGSDEDEDLIRFLTMYLRSDFVRYLLLHTAYSLAVERPRITLKEVKKLPFVLPQHHANPVRANKIIREVANITRSWEHADVFERQANAEILKEQANKLILNYFELDEREILLVHDTCQTLIPSVQPGGYGVIRTACSACPTKNDIKLYVFWVEKELQRWKTVLGGEGTFDIETTSSRPGAIGALGITRITLSSRKKPVKTQINNQAVANTIEFLRTRGLLPMQAFNNLYLSADFLIHAHDAMYLVKSLVKRLWLPSQALNDAQRIVNAVRTVPANNRGSDVAFE